MKTRKAVSLLVSAAVLFTSMNLPDNTLNTFASADVQGMDTSVTQALAQSDKFEFNGLGYIVTDAENSQVYVYECAQAVSAGTLIIPQTVQYAGIEYTVVGIGPYAFYDQNITKVSIPDTVKAIGAYAFMNTSLSSVYLPESVETIGKYAFGIDYEGKTVDVDNAEITLDEIKTNTVTN